MTLFQKNKDSILSTLRPITTTVSGVSAFDVEIFKVAYSQLDPTKVDKLKFYFQVP